MQGKHTLFGQLLVERGLITPLQRDEAVHKQQTTMAHRKIGEILVRLRHIDKSDVTKCLAVQLDIPIIWVSERDIPEQIRSLIESDVAILYRMVPIEERGNVVVVATTDPANTSNLDNVSRLIGRPVAPVIASQEEIYFAINRYYVPKTTTGKAGYATDSDFPSDKVHPMDIQYVSIAGRKIPEAIRKLIPPKVAILYRVIPIALQGEVLVLATARPDHKNNLDSVSRLIGRPVLAVRTSDGEISQALRRLYGADDGENPPRASGPPPPSPSRKA